MGAFKLHFNEIIFPEAEYIPISYYEKQWQTRQGLNADAFKFQKTLLKHSKYNFKECSSI